MITDNERMQQIRHYDTIHWAIIGIMLTALGALMKASLECTEPKWLINLAGLYISIAGIYYVGSFRRWMHVIDASITDYHSRRFLDQIRATNQGPRTWSVLVSTVGLMDVGFLWKYIGIYQDFYQPIYFMMIGAAFAGSLIQLWERGNNK